MLLDRESKPSLKYPQCNLFFEKKAKNKLIKAILAKFLRSLRLLTFLTFLIYDCCVADTEKNYRKWLQKHKV